MGGLGREEEKGVVSSASSVEGGAAGLLSESKTKSANRIFLFFENY